MDLANGHLLALEALAPDSRVFDNCPSPAKYKAYNLGKGKGMSVLQIVEAMKKATGFDYQCEVIGRRCVSLTPLQVRVLTQRSDGETSQISRRTQR